ncbi:bifunctional DNA primase/polymerase [Ancylobacter sp. TS-1]|uniref:bifunctional DNA primase/polymerase n=1 Tax=Ancylobacter sp. TS-1 TaxID=1850374 RepID=UPI001265C36D|nr:bifunctional DNA primase/polymerase [Ancylobacter sp. TS-1]QFR33831.1 hypothetical protein GBB76_12305 [Ancylobacter sp. TS-1]
MGADIFATEAPKYWDKGLPIVPVEPGTKRPARSLKGWDGFLSSPASEATKSKWLKNFSDHGVGLLLGHPVGDGTSVVVLDIDDDRLVRAVRGFLGFNRTEQRALLVAKRGKKGLTIFLRAPSEPKFKSTTVRGAEGIGNIDVLSAGKMTVMPPFDHPEPGIRYVFEGVSVLDIELGSLVKISSREINILRAFVGSEHTLALLEGSETHNAGLQVVLAMVRAGATDEEISDTILGLLPENYDGNSVKELPGWITWARENGDVAEQPDGESLTAALVKLLRDGAELFHDGQGNAFATAEGLTLRVPSHALGVKLRSRAYHALSKPIGFGPLREAMATLEAVALHGDTVYRVHTRTAGDVRGIEVDLGRRDGRVVQITRDGWAVTSAASFRFVRGDGFGELPEPVRGGRLRDLQTFLRLDEENFLLIVAFLLNALRPGGPFFILLVEGEQSSGKSLLAEVIKRILDPNRAVRMRLPEKDHDLMIQAKEFAVLNFDNASGVKADMSDALCTLATGGGLAVRRLYTDGELSVLSFCRPLIINGIGGFVTRPDLMDRSIPIRLPPLPEGTRRTEEEIWREFDRLLPGLLGALYEAAASAMRNYDAVEPPTTLRMADAARWIRAAEEAVGVPPGGLVQAIRDAQDAFVVESVNDDPIVTKLRAVLKKGPFNGSVGDLFDRFDFVETRNLPRTPSQLSRHLKRLRPALAKVGIGVEFLPRTRQGQLIRIEATPSNDGGV